MRDWGDPTRHVVPSALAWLPSPCGVRHRRCPPGSKSSVEDRLTCKGLWDPRGGDAPLALPGDKDEPGGLQGQGGQVTRGLKDLGQLARPPPLAPPSSRRPALLPRP